MKITVCVPVLNRYDLLEKLIQSAEEGIVKPDKYLIVNNGIQTPILVPGTNMEVYEPRKNIGVAASWNWLIRNSEEIRIICNDDIEFYPNTLLVIKENYTNKGIIFPEYAEKANIYSFFVISDYVFSLVGEFDETLSPNYGYFEDNDYDFRLKKILAEEGKDVINYIRVPCGYKHAGSSTIKRMSRIEMEEHHRKFKIAKDNFRKKWGKLP